MHRSHVFSCLEGRLDSRVDAILSPVAGKKYTRNLSVYMKQRLRLEAFNDSKTDKLISF